MKVSGAVAMADDPGHAFGIYFEKIEPGIASIPTGGSAPAVGCARGEPVRFDAQKEKPQFNPRAEEWAISLAVHLVEARSSLHSGEQIKAAASLAADIAEALTKASRGYYNKRP